MKLTTLTDYALRTLMFLAVREQRTHVAEVAKLFGISTNHIAKAVNLLARAGYVHSTRGVGGGIELALELQDISIGEVIAYMEGDTHLLACVGDDESCAIHAFCKLKGVLADAERVHQAYLRGVTLADVIPTRQQLNRIG